MVVAWAGCAGGGGQPATTATQPTDTPAGLHTPSATVTVHNKNISYSVHHVTYAGRRYTLIRVKGVEGKKDRLCVGTKDY